MSKRSIPEEMPLGLEDVVLGKILNDPACLPVLSRGLKDGSYFSDELFGEYYDAFLECFANHGTVDIMLVEPYLDKRNLPLGDLGRFERAAAKAGGQGEDYVERIWAAHKRKGRTEQLEAWLVELRSCADQGSFDSLTARMVAELMKDGPSGDNRIKTMKEVAVEISDEIDLVCSGNKALGLPFGFNSIDLYTGGMLPTDLVVIAGLQKSGKSTMQIQIAFHNAEKGVPILWFSCEMEASKIFYRKALMDLGLRWTDYVAGRFSKADQVRLSKKVEGLSTLPIFYKDTSFAVSDIMAISAQYVKAHKVGLICVDYIQRVVPPNRSDNRESEVASISSALKSIAMDLQVPVLAVSQTNEQLKTRESRAIEMDMDKMILIGTNKTPRDETTENVEIGITQRMGVSIELGEISLPYDRRCGKWLSGGEVFTGAVVGFE